LLKSESAQNSSAGQEAKRITVCIKNKLGLHLRPASQLVKIANQFPDSEISIAKDGQEVNAKSIMGVVMLAAELGCELEIEAVGPSADEALASLGRLIEDGFGEEM
jgi:phosphocarrier protein